MKSSQTGCRQGAQYLLLPPPPRRPRPPPCSRALVSSERLHLPPELWVQTLRELLVPVATGGAAMQAWRCLCSMRAARCLPGWAACTSVKGGDRAMWARPGAPAACLPAPQTLPSWRGPSRAATRGRRRACGWRSACSSRRCCRWADGAYGVTGHVAKAECLAGAQRMPRCTAAPCQRAARLGGLSGGLIQRCLHSAESSPTLVVPVCQRPKARLSPPPPPSSQYIEVVQTDKDFYALWQAVLQALQVGGRAALD